MYTKCARLGVVGVLAGSCAAGLYGCNSPTSSDGSSDSTTESAAGVWSGTDSISGLAVTGIVNAAGTAVFVRSDGEQFTGTTQVSGSTLAATLDGYSNFGASFSDGSTTGVGTLNGSVTTASSLTGTLTFTTSTGTAQNQSWSLSYDTLTSTGSSLQAVSGSFTDGTSGASVAIDALGNINSQNANDGCVLTGTVATADSTRDIYEVLYSYSECTGNNAALNGVQFSGLAVLNSNQTPHQLIIAVSGRSSSASYGLVSYLNAS